MWNCTGWGSEVGDIKVIACTPTGERNFTQAQGWRVWLDKPGPPRWVMVFGTMPFVWDAAAEHFGVEVDELCAVHEPRQGDPEPERVIHLSVPA